MSPEDRPDPVRLEYATTPHEEPPAPSRFERCVLAVIISLVSFRIVALPLLLWWCLFPRRDKRDLWVSIALLAALASPVDVGLPGIGWLRGTPRPGVRLVEVGGPHSMGFRMIRRYGEFIVVPYWQGLYRPVKLVVWW